MHALLVRWVHCARGVLERSGVLRARVLGGEGGDCVRGIYLVSFCHGNHG